MSLINAATIVYEDNHIIVADKPAGLVTQSSLEHPNSLQSLLRESIKKRDHRESLPYLHAVHRLDKQVSGLVIFAASSKALSRLQHMIREHMITKVYECLVEGVMKDKDGVLVHQLIKQHQKSHLATGEKGQKAELSFVVLEHIGNTSRLKIHLKTGRYHQIRSQLSIIGHPIVGDTLYGSKKSTGSSIALAHVEVTMIHPVKKTPLTITKERSTMNF